MYVHVYCKLQCMIYMYCVHIRPHPAVKETCTVQHSYDYRQVPYYYTLRNLSIYIYSAPKWFERVQFLVANSY